LGRQEKRLIFSLQVDPHIGFVSATAAGADPLDALFAAGLGRILGSGSGGIGGVGFRQGAGHYHFRLAATLFALAHLFYLFYGLTHRTLLKSYCQCG
jgi:hypothetical protein